MQQRHPPWSEWGSPVMQWCYPQQPKPPPWPSGKRGGRRAGSKWVEFHTINRSLSWDRHCQYLQEECLNRITQGAVPIVAGQEHGKVGDWYADASAALFLRGWKVLGAPAKQTALGGASAGGFIAVPSCVSVQKAKDQQKWDVSPPGSPGRLVMGKVATHTFQWLLVFSVYLHHGQPVGSMANSSILNQLTEWVVKEGRPWLAMGDWNNEPEQLRDSPWSRVLRARVVGPGAGNPTCRHSSASTSIYDYMFCSEAVAAAIGEVQVGEDYSPHAPARVWSSTSLEGI